MSDTHKDGAKKVVTRFAPSPTGYMHIGGVRTALFAWALARQNNGTFILRIEDTDKEREVEGSIQQIIDSLKWIGIDWDEGIDIGGPAGEYLQSKRIDRHTEVAKQLVAKGLAYADPYSAEEVEAFRKKAEEEKRPFLYRDHRPENPPIWDGTKPLRLKVTNIKAYEWNDLVRGKLSAGPEALDDFILIKSDGYPTYNFAHIVDDLDMGVTHILRSDEFISSVPKFLSLYDALEITPPLMAILPPIMSPTGNKKLSKRDGAKDALGYRDEGYLPSALLNFLVLIGWNPGDDTEIITPEEFIKMFDVTKIQRSGGGFNEEKLNWINKEHMKRLPQQEQFDFVLKFISSDFVNACSEQKIARVLPMIIERISYGKQASEMEEKGELDFLIKQPTLDLAILNWNGKQNNAETITHLEAMKRILTDEIPESGADDTITAEAAKETIMKYASGLAQRGASLHPLRYALTGLASSPDPFSVIYMLGKTESLSRIQIALDQLAG
ncbi:MAG: glutamate--tRNA ligase [Candidatus Pacebacteria bacterium]|nr:glutamate--tRNA ligase [Candidatus Paceibacterota bacterium]MBP9851778.1 glutamate--tRNA ligase [Candidatus Paceibacterota bacterium]